METMYLYIRSFEWYATKEAATAALAEPTDYVDFQTGRNLKRMAASVMFQTAFENVKLLWICWRSCLPGN
jgi:hypothetical protein